MPNFKRFDRKAAPITTEPFLSVQKNWKSISINHASFLLLGEPETVEVLYDEGEEVLGLRKVPKSEPYAFPVRKQGRTRNYLISTQAFANHFGLKADVARRYHAEMLEDGVLAAYLKEGGVEATGPSTGRRPASRDRG